MNILYFLGKQPSASSFIANEVSEMKRRGHNIAIFALNKLNRGFEHPELDGLNIPIQYANPVKTSKLHSVLSRAIIKPRVLKRAAFIDHPKQNISHLHKANQAIRFMSDIGFEPDLVHSHFASPGRYPAAFVAASYNVPWTVTTHAYDIFAPPSSKYLTRIFNCTSCLVTISEYNKKHLQSELGVLTPIKVVRAAIRPEKFTPSKDTIPNRILTVASNVEKKGYRDGLHAIAKVSKDITDLEYRIIGWTPEDAPELIDLIKKLNLEDVVTVVGRVSDEELIFEIDKAQLFLLPSKIASNGDRDGIPVALMEAMAMKTPAVSTDISGIPELIDHEETGFLSAPGSEEQLARTIRSALSSDTATMGEKCRQKVVSDFNIKVEAEKLETVFRTAVTSTKRR